ncbi:MAG: CoA-binding protein [Elusimicrobiota bacterium]
MASNQDYEALLKLNVVAVVGCSPKTERPSCQVASYLMEAGYRIIPVNPNYKTVLGEICYPDLKSITEDVEVVSIFRGGAHVMEIVRQAVAIGAKGIWIQDGIEAPEAAKLARDNGLVVVENDCFMRQHLSRCGR